MPSAVVEVMDINAPTTQHIKNCSFSSWYSLYKKHIPKSRVIKPLPKEFIEYLLADGLHLPDEDQIEWENTSDSGDWDDEDNEAEEVADPTLQFSSLHKQIGEVIQELGGKVMPKLNWSAPRDATWISTTSDMKCVNPSDVYMLLKASSYITHDLSEAFDLCEANDGYTDHEFELVLRKWVDMNRSVEFRCFAKDRELVGVTQRDMNYYDFLEPLREHLLDLIEDFFEANLQTTFHDPCFVFDVYIPRPFDRVWLVDINPWASKTDTHLYSWEMLKGLGQDAEPELRLVDKMDSTRGFGSTEHTESTVPKDFVDASVSGTGIAEIAKQLRDHLNVQNQQDSSSDSE